MTRPRVSFSLKNFYLSDTTMGERAFELSIESIGAAASNLERLCLNTIPFVGRREWEISHAKLIASVIPKCVGLKNLFLRIDDTECLTLPPSLEKLCLSYERKVLGSVDESLDRRLHTLLSSNGIPLLRDLLLDNSITYIRPSTTQLDELIPKTTAFCRNHRISVSPSAAINSKSYLLDHFS